MSQKSPSSSVPKLNKLSGITLVGVPTNGQVLSYNSTENVLEWVDSSGGGSTSMGDLSLLLLKEFEGKLLFSRSTRTTVGTLGSITASTGKDLYIVSAKITLFLDTIPGEGLSTIFLQINGVVVEILRAKMIVSSGSASASTYSYEFKSMGHKVTAGQTINIQVSVIDADITAEGMIQCFEEDTGVSPV